jgi:hypothetical protein|nr:MAG TPA: hypothetical protein [Caudoviricetes sp.]
MTIARKTTEVKFVRKIRFITYPAGRYDPNTSYVCTEAAGPFVEQDGQYYAMYKQGTWLGSSIGRTPKEDYAQYGSDATWRLMDKYKALIVEMLFSDYAKLGSAIFLGDYMFSQYGIRNGAQSNAYQNFDPNNLDAFRPNIFVDWLKGHIEALSGYFAGDLSCKSMKLQLSDAPEGTVYNNYLITNSNVFDRKFPKLDNGVVRSFEMIIPLMTRSPYPYDFTGEDSTVYFCVKGNRFEKMGKVISLYNIQGTKFTVVGFGESGKTYWNIYPGDSDSEGYLDDAQISN